MGAPDIKPVVPMPVKVTPYRHQVEAFNFVCTLFGLAEPEKGGAWGGPSNGEMPPVRAGVPALGSRRSGA